MSHYKPYPAYKDSGIEWIGEVPEGWKIISIKCLEGNSANVVQTGPFGAQLHADDYVDEGVPLILIRNVRDMRIDDTNIPQVSLSDAERLSMYRLREGDIVFSRVGSIGRIALCTERENGWLISGQMLRLRMTNLSVDKKFVAYAFESPSLLTFVELQSVGSTRESINTEILRNMPLPMPDIIEQREISAFLDRQTAHIDALITKKTRFIELLKEKRQALITHAVTKGLDPNVKMKDSGVEWIGEVPEHWERRKLSHAFAKIGSGTTPPSDQPEWYSDDGIPWVTTGELRESEITKTTKCVTQRALDQFTTLRVYPKGSLAIAMYGATIGRLGILGVAATTNQACCVLSGGKSMTVRFVYYWLLVCKQPIIEIFAAGGGQPNINQEIISGLRVPSPSIDEQDAIAECLDREVAHLDLITEKTQRSIDLLRERRSALITAAVTGKIDLRGSL